LPEVPWSQALAAVAARFKDIKARDGKFGIIDRREPPTRRISISRSSPASPRTNNIDHHRSGDIVALLDAVSGQSTPLATTVDLYNKKAILIIWRRSRA